LIRKSDYENYDYREFWEDGSRLYEDNSERLALKKLFRSVDMRDRTFIDLGCGYGRLFNEYMDFKNIILVDYSLNNLKNARETISRFLGPDNEKLKKIYFVSADVRHLPFRDSIIDAALTVRVIHHISDPEELFKEVKRILNKDSLFLLEFANKRNLKNILRFFTGRLKKSPFSIETFHVGETILNYHPKRIKNLLVKNGFEIKKQISVSNFRLGFLKKHIKINSLVFFENFFQNIFSWKGLGPSIFFKTVCYKYDTEKDTGLDHNIKPAGLFICPSCKSGPMNFTSDGRIICRSCSKEFRTIDGIYDFKL
jgi:ubiquinone/menaquinone biosynthesis C-methylase UbiE